MNSVVLVGAPNSGKTSLFNWLTGSQFKTVNYPGATVESHVGKSLAIYGESFQVVDTPGLYSLTAQDADERITLEVLTFSENLRVVLVVDATQLERHLLLAVQLRELGVPFVMAVSMGDLIGQAESKLDINRIRDAFDCEVVPVDGRLGGGVLELAAFVQNFKVKSPVVHLSDVAKLEEHLAIHTQTGRALAKKVVVKPSLSVTHRLDRFLLFSSSSFLIFFLAMTLIFSSVFYLASPFMDIVDTIFSNLSAGFSGLMGEGLLSDFISSGLIEGTGAVLVFVPQIFILFLLIGFFEESGYLARASTLIDRPFQSLGLSGRSFVPILSGFACAVPAIMATRNLKSARERWIAVFILPFMTCSARLPVYALLLAFIFFGEPAWKPGLTLALIYFGSLILGGIAAFFLHQVIGKKATSYFMMELPPYRWPSLIGIFKSSLRKTLSYVKKAGPTILVFVLVLWSLTHLPYDASLSDSEQLSQSYLGQAGKTFEPVFTPMGLDWRAGVSLGAAFVAREVFVSSMAIIFNLTDLEEESMQDSLLTQMQTATFSDGRKVFSFPSVAAMIVFFMIALQCITTTAVTIREMGSWTYGIVQLIALNIFAYGAAVATYQLLS